MENKKVIKKMVLITIFSLIILFLLQFIYLVPESHYSILDQTGKVELKDYPELKKVRFMYSTNLYIEYTEPINLELEKINFRFNDEVIGTAEINKNINDLEDFAEPYIDEKSEEKIIRKTYPLQKEFLRILGRNAEVYDSLEDGRFYIDIYIKDLKTNETFIIKLLDKNSDLFLSDFDDIQQNIIKKLHHQQIIILNSKNQLIPNRLIIKALNDFYENDCICNKVYQKYLNSLNVHLDYKNSLFSDSEVDYLNFIMNKKQFSNGYDLRNKYIHGTQSINKDMHSYDYYLLLMIHCFIALKIYDEFANKKPYHATN